jgi:hypothetical protein
MIIQFAAILNYPPTKAAKGNQRDLNAQVIDDVL